MMQLQGCLLVLADGCGGSVSWIVLPMLMVALALLALSVSDDRA